MVWLCCKVTALEAIGSIQGWLKQSCGFPNQKECAVSSTDMVFKLQTLNRKQTHCGWFGTLPRSGYTVCLPEIKNYWLDSYYRVPQWILLGQRLVLPDVERIISYPCCISSFVKLAASSPSSCKYIQSCRGIQRIQHVTVT